MAAVPDRTTESAGVIAIVSPDRSIITALSKSTGKSAQVHGSNFDIRKVMVTADLVSYGDAGHVYAYSATTNKWGTLDLPAGLDAEKVSGPVSTLNAVAVAVPGMVYAFDPATGTWPGIEVPGESPVEPLVSPDFVKISAGDKIYLFSSKTGKWTDGL